MDSCLATPREAPTYLLSIAGGVLASLLAITLLSWNREACIRKAKSGRRHSLAAAAGAEVQAKKYPEYTMEAVHPHCTAKDAWVVIGDGVYDVTKWAPHHPGGERNIVDISGRCLEQRGTFIRSSRTCNSTAHG